MATRRIAVEYYLGDYPVVHTRNWGLAPSATPSANDLLTILGAIHNVPTSTIFLVSARQYWEVETTPAHPALSKESES
jgi:hypothetical protein